MEIKSKRKHIDAKLNTCTKCVNLMHTSNANALGISALKLTIESILPKTVESEDVYTWKTMGTVLQEYLCCQGSI